MGITFLMKFTEIFCHLQNYVIVTEIKKWNLVEFCWRRWWQPTPVLLPGKSHGWRSLVGCSPWGHEDSDTTERLDFHFSLSCTGEENGKPLQGSCLENPRDGGAWWVAVYGVAQSRTRLKRLSSSKRGKLGLINIYSVVRDCLPSLQYCVWIYVWTCHCHHNSEW